MDIEKVAREFGLNNLRIFIPMQRIQYLFAGIGCTSSDDPYEVRECVIDTGRYNPIGEVLGGFKVELRDIKGADDPDNYFGSRTFYCRDFNNLARRNPDEYRVYVMVDEDDKYERIR